jgi:hypothetical protein
MNSALDALDDRTVAYVVASQPLFDDLRQVASQLAGLLVLKATGSREASPEHPMLKAARRLFDEVRARIELAQPTERARPHHARLREAAEALAAALAAAGPVLASAGGADFDTAMTPLRAAYDELQRASRALPGFRMVAFEQGCCAGHAFSSASTLPT